MMLTTSLKQAPAAGAAPDAHTAAIILVIVADEALRASIAAALASQDYHLLDALDGAAAVECVRRSEPDVIVLDSRRARAVALDVCRRLRTVTDACILVLAEAATADDTVLALSTGADDVLDVPFRQAELAARVRSLLRRPRQVPSAPMDCPPSFSAGSPRPGAPSISVVLPAYNEEALIEGAVHRVAAVVSHLTVEHEIIVVDDGSRDHTGEILAALKAAEPELRLRIVTHETNRGYGAALASGFDAAWKDLIFFTDGDEQFDVAELARFLPEMTEGTDLVIGWRERRADPPIRLFNAWGWKQLVNGLFGYTACDVDCAFKLFRRTVWESLTVRARGATFSAELLVKARRLGLQVTELPVRHFPRTAGSATGARPAVIARAFKELFELWRNLDRELAEDPRAAHMRTVRRPAAVSRPV